MGVIFRAIKYTIKNITKILNKKKLLSPHVIMHIDGGICSQMLHYMYSIGYRDNGITVEYDMSFFNDNGTDGTGMFVRKFELLEMFPTLQFSKANNVKVFLFSNFFTPPDTDRNLPKNICGPTYLNDYFIYPSDCFLKDFSKCFDITKLLYKPKIKIVEEKICGIHVRRGDLADGKNYFYGGVSDDYFKCAIDFVKKSFNNVYFRLFSDDVNYLYSEIIPLINMTNYEVVSGQGLKAWEELCELAFSDVIIASQGSFGKYAACMNYQNIMLILCNNCYADYWIECGLNVHLI